MQSPMVLFLHTYSEYTKHDKVSPFVRGRLRPVQSGDHLYY